MPQGYVALILHAHLPFVRHPEYEEFLEEDWLYEAITETYIPIIKVMEGLVREALIPADDVADAAAVFDAVGSVVAGTLHKHISRLIDLTEREIERTKGIRPSTISPGSITTVFRRRARRSAMGTDAT